MNSLDPSKSIKMLNSSNTPTMPNTATLLNTAPNTVPNSISSTVNSSTPNNSIFQNSTFKIIMLLLILAFLGFNIFKYLANTTDIITNNFSPTIINFFKEIGIITEGTIKNIVDNTNKGIKATSNESAKIINKTLDVPKNISKAINNKTVNHHPEPDKAGNKTQSSKGKSKSGFCFIGEDRGFRSCVKVSESDTCLSEQIYPTRELCINPNLRP